MSTDSITPTTISNAAISTAAISTAAISNAAISTTTRFSAPPTVFRALRAPTWVLALLVAFVLPLTATSHGQEPPSAPLGAPASFGAETLNEEMLGVEAGRRLRAEPAERSRYIARIDTETELPVVERRDDGWVRLRFGALTGWLHPEVDDETTDDDLAGTDVSSQIEAWRDAPPPSPPTENAQLPVKPRTADPERLAAAVALLSPEHLEHRESKARLGPFALYTDLEDDRLLRGLDRLVTHLPSTFQERYGLDPGDLSELAVVLFARESSYRELVGGDADLAGLESWGHAGHGIAILAIRQQSLSETRALLIHEITHLLMRSALGNRIPAWLDEGVAVELSYSHVRRDGALEPERLARSISLVSDDARRAGQFDQTPAFRQLHSLRRQWELQAGPPVAFADMLAMPQSVFVDPEMRPMVYPQSAFLIRMLLSDEAATKRFHAFLAELQEGSRGGMAALLRHLEVDAAELEEHFEGWLVHNRATGAQQ